ncbi:piggybac transposable element-derived protein 4 [Holotrichia oblita]|uniref:Piggybac transposable element-derived protein 4 n=1 Tax=Holotrichia oblita TaxID=644536 RepID=A0ACB9SPX2_HOLOL|nr:piggybac transposable element-derived protein 4 [Holotrichia oblita]
MTYCGTMRQNRKGVPSSMKTKLKKGESFGLQKNETKLIKWHDKRPVLMLSTDSSHDSTLQETGKFNRKAESVKKPKCVIDYNMAKKGVDVSDQMASYHTVVRKSFKWYKKVILELLCGTAVVNAWIVYNKIATTKYSITNFRKLLAKALTEDDIELQTITSKRLVHTFIKPEGPGRKKRKMCVGCYAKFRKEMPREEADKRARRIISYCGDCPKQPGYCLQCFNEVHKN